MSDGPVYPPPGLPIPPTPPMGGYGRSGPAWEGPGAFVQRFIDTVRPALTDPKAFFANMRLTGGVAAPVTYYLVGMAVGALGNALWSSLGFGAGRFGGMPGSGFVSVLVMTVCLGVVGLFIGSGIFHLMLSLLGAARQPFEATLRVVAYGGGSTALFNVVPFCGGIVGAVYGMVLYILGLQNVHECDTAKAAIAVLAPAVVCCVLLALAWGAVMALIFGAAAAGAMR